MITFDSPLTAVLGAATPAKRKKFTDGLGLRTVGDLLRHFPRRYLETGSLTNVKDLRIGQMLCVVGEIERCDTHPYRDRRTGRTAYRVEAVLRTGGQYVFVGAVKPIGAIPLVAEQVEDVAVPPILASADWYSASSSSGRHMPSSPLTQYAFRRGTIRSKLPDSRTYSRCSPVRKYRTST